MEERDEYFLLRRKKGITLGEVADHVKCSAATISLMERGKLKQRSEVKWRLYKDYIDGKK